MDDMNIVKHVVVIEVLCTNLRHRRIKIKSNMVVEYERFIPKPLLFSDTPTDSKISPLNSQGGLSGIRPQKPNNVF